MPDRPVAELKPPPNAAAADIVRTALAMGVFAGALGSAGIVGLVNRNRAWGAHIASTVGADLALAAAGVQLRIIGQENAWSARPAVFTFNHQSQLDIWVLGSLLRKDFSGVAKKSLQKDPLFGPLGYFTGVVYIDRADSAQARSGLEAAVAALRSGTSIAIAPEGTRSRTPALLPFKKGAFHLAMEANVPMVPIVMRNCGEIMASHSMVIRSGVVDVAVLPPIPTDEWTKDNLDEQAARVREMYLDALARWPSRL